MSSKEKKALFNYLLEKLKSNNVTEREEAWTELAQRTYRGKLRLSRHDRESIAKAFLGEQDQGVKVIAQSCATGIALLTGGGSAPTRSATRVPTTLGEWLWKPFESECQVLTVFDPGKLRDQRALFMLGQRLPNIDNVCVEDVTLYNANWGLLVRDETTPKCIVGRLRLFGPTADERWRPPESKYQFVSYERPAELKAGAIDPAYHCIYVGPPGDQPESLRYQTHDDGKTRYDYCVVRRFRDKMSPGRPVLTFEGASSLGTLAAVRWAARSLVRPDAFNGAIPLPDIWSEVDLFEALLEVRARNTDHAWMPESISIREMTLGDWKWDIANRHWVPTRRDSIVVRRENGIAQSIEYGGERKNMKSHSVVFRLMSGLLIWASETGLRSATTTQVAEQSRNWPGFSNHEKPLDAEKVFDHLKRLPNKGFPFKIRNQVIQLDDGVDLRIIDDDPPVAKPILAARKRSSKKGDSQSASRRDLNKPR